MTTRPTAATAAIAWRGALVGLLLLLVMAAGPTHAQPAPEPTVQLRQAEADVRAIQHAAGGKLDETERALLRARLATSRQSAAAVGERLAGSLTALDARIAELGDPTGPGEPAEIRQQRASLAGERLSLDAAAKRARLLELEAQQLDAEMQREQAEEFGARMSRRVASPVTPAFWGAVLASFQEDLTGIRRFLATSPAWGGGPPTDGWLAGLGVVIAALLLGPGRVGALRLGRRAMEKGAASRLERSGYALWVTFVGALFPILAAVAVTAGVRLSGIAPPAWDTFLNATITAIGFAAFTAAVLGALLMRSHPQWRLAGVHDAVAERLRPLTWILATVTGLGALISAFNTAVGASAAALVASNALEAAGSLVLIGGALIVLGRLQAAEADRDGGAVANAGVSALSLLLWIVVLVSLGALLLGYVEFSRFLVGIIVWATVLGASTFLLMTAADAAATAVFSRRSRLGRTLVRGVGVRASTIDQFGLLVSGGVRIFLGLVALILFAAPFGAGSGVESSLERFASAADGLDVGGVTLSPGTFLRALLVFAVGLALVRAFLSWLERRYLPTTELDRSGRNSVSLIARYLGFAAVTLWALTALGVGLEKMALLLSALSVGIGFGLQAITQNFISGLILLAERPIKIGDLVKVGNDEGDVRRINVRSTEIVLGDHSTLIVPNSELITKTVLNKTLASPLGRVQIQFSAPIEADAAQVEEILAAAFAAEPAILAEPAPSIFIDSIAEGRISFNSFAHVQNPRAAYSARSGVLKTLLRALRDAGIELGGPPQKFVMDATPPGTAPAGPEAQAPGT